MSHPPEITPLGTVIYARTHWEPPPCPSSYNPRSTDPTSDDAWILDPVDTVCKYFKPTLANLGACGYQRIAHYCKLIESFVGDRTCSTCPKKIEISLDNQ